MKYEKYNSEFKNIDTEDKAYLLGFIYGDGSISYSNNNYRLSIGTHIDDIKIIDYFANKYKFLKKKTYKRLENVVYLNCYQKAFIMDLKELGVLESKSAKNYKLLRFPNIADNIIPHFIRGLFDADGSVYSAKNSRSRSRNNISMEITLVNEIFIKQLHTYLPYLTFRTRKPIKHYKIPYTLRSTSKDNSLKFYDYIYLNATIFLERKKKIFEKYYPTTNFIFNQKLKELGVTCDKCSNDSFIKGATRANKNELKLRIKCKKCDKMKSINCP